MKAVNSQNNKMFKIIVRETNIIELSFATQSHIRKPGKPAAVSIIDNIISSPTNAKRYKREYTFLAKLNKKYIPEKELLALAKLSKFQYMLIRQENKLSGTHI